MAHHSSGAEIHDHRGSGATPWLAFILGVVVTAVAVMAVFVLAGGAVRHETRSIDIDLQAPTPSIPAHPPSPPKLPTPSTPTQ